VRPEFLVGLDLGQSIDFTALAVAEVLHVPTGEQEAVPGVVGQSRSGAVVAITRPKTAKHFAVRHLERFELGLSYPRMVDDVAALLNREPLKSADVTLLLDRTGVGRPVSDLFELAPLNCTLVPVSIHGGDHETRDGAAWSVPKRDLVASTQKLLQQGRLRIAADLPLAAVLAEELGAFQVRISQSGHDSYSAREGAHDDLLLALSLVCWFGGDDAVTEWF
jgi:hypothetical protein